MAKYEDFIYNITNLLQKDELYPKYAQSIISGKNDYKISQVFTKKNYDSSWIDEIEGAINSLDTIVRNPRKFIVIEEDIVDISLARSISVESVKHLAQHTNLISSVNKEGMVIPNKILNTSKEESYEIYENRFVYTLIKKTADFITRRSDSIKKALAESGELGVNIVSDFNIDGSRVSYNLGASANFAFEETVRKKGDKAISDLERIKRITSIFNDFLGSAFAKEMKSCAEVRPPILRTNVILKDPNFKKALLLWQYVESNENMTYKIETTEETAELSPVLSDKYRSLIFLNTILMQSIAKTREAGKKLDSQLNKEEFVADEYVTKNIDDYVPDDFPELKMDLNEIRRIYYKIPGSKTLKLTEISKMNAALDRVIRQYKINKAKADSKAQQRLIAMQIKEEQLAKTLALREAKEKERRAKFLEAERIRTEKRLALEAKLAAEKHARDEAEAEKARREQELASANAEAARLRAIDEAESEKRLAEARALAEAERLEEAARLEKQLYEKQETYWRNERALALKVQRDLDKKRIKDEEAELLSDLLASDAAKQQELDRIHRALLGAIVVNHYHKIEDTKNKVYNYLDTETPTTATQTKQSIDSIIQKEMHKGDNTTSKTTFLSTIKSKLTKRK